MIESRDDRPWGIGHAAAAVFLALTASTVVGLAVGPDLTDAELFRFVLPAQALTQIGVVAWLASQSRRRRISLGFRFEAGDWVGLPLGVAFQYAASLALLPFVLWFLDGEAPTQEVVESAAGLAGFDVVFVILGAGLLAPLAEELVFRGALLRALMVRGGTRFATWVSAGAFAALHLLDPNAWLVVPVLFVLGVVLARVTIGTGRLGKAIAIHVGFNLIAVVSLLWVGS